jgi:hypothetical protein
MHNPKTIAAIQKAFLTAGETHEATAGGLIVGLAGFQEISATDLHAKIAATVQATEAGLRKRKHGN